MVCAIVRTRPSSVASWRAHSALSRAAVNHRAAPSGSHERAGDAAPAGRDGARAAGGGVYDDEIAAIVLDRGVHQVRDPRTVGRDPRVGDPALAVDEGPAERQLDREAAPGPADDRELGAVGGEVGVLIAPAARASIASRRSGMLAWRTLTATLRASRGSHAR